MPLATVVLVTLGAAPSLAVQPPQDQTKLNKPIILPPLNGPATLDFNSKPKQGNFTLQGSKVDQTPTSPVTEVPGSGFGITSLQPPSAFRGDGYTQDSAAQSQTEQRSKKFTLPGVSLKVPLY